MPEKHSPLSPARMAKIERLVDPRWGYRPINDVVRDLLADRAFYREKYEETQRVISLTNLYIMRLEARVDALVEEVADLCVISEFAGHRAGCVPLYPQVCPGCKCGYDDAVMAFAKRII